MLITSYPHPNGLNEFFTKFDCLSYYKLTARCRTTGKEQPMKDFIILGGDLRLLYAAAKLNRHHNCCVYGFDTLHEDIHKGTGVEILREIKPCSNVVLPLPMSRNCDFITAPYFPGKIPVCAVIDAAAENATVYCGKACPELREICREKSLTLVDYFEREELIVVNAAITAEGAVEIIMREKSRAIMGMNILVTGFGRIAKILSRYLHSLGANVTICARKFSDLAWAEIAGCSAVHINNVDEVLDDFDTIVNTVPAQIFDKSRLLKLKSDCLVVDLASKAGVEGMESAKPSQITSVAGIKVVWALSIPGKFAPVTAGEIKNTMPLKPSI